MEIEEGRPLFRSSGLNQGSSQPIVSTSNPHSSNIFIGFIIGLQMSYRRFLMYILYHSR